MKYNWLKNLKIEKIGNQYFIIQMKYFFRRVRETKIYLTSKM